MKKKHDLAGQTGKYPPIEATFRLTDDALGRLQERFGGDVVVIAGTFMAARTYANELMISVRRGVA